MSLNTILPKPSFSVHDRDFGGPQPSSMPMVKVGPPPYGYRKGWVPRNPEDYGDGGAFPEIAVAQYPLNMGYKTNSQKCLQLQVDPTGKPKYDALVRQGVNKSKIVYSKFTDLLPKEITDDDAQYARPDEEVVKNATQKTRQALEKLVATKISAAMPVQHAPKQAPAQFIRYMPSQQGLVQSSGPKQRIIRMVQAQKDPMEPPRFKINKKIPRAPPSPPVPVLHSPTRKVTVKEQQEWKIPPCISNWKNAKGYTIPLDKRLAADGRGLQSVHINEGFAKLAEALYVADRQAREAIELRAQLERKLAQKEKDKKEEGLRKLAEHARAVRAGVNMKSIDNPEFIEREEMRRERQRERQRERGIQRAAPEKRSKLLKERERDITEKIALGLPNAGNGGGELQYDVRLLNLSKGLDSGFADDEAYNVYDKPWREESAIANTLYRPSKNIDKELYGDDIEKIANMRRFVPDRGFDKTENSTEKAAREGPVQFEKHASKQMEEEEEDPFGLGQFFEQVKKTTRKSSTTNDGQVNKKRRKD